MLCDFEVVSRLQPDDIEFALAREQAVNAAPADLKPIYHCFKAQTLSSIANDPTISSALYRLKRVVVLKGPDNSTPWRPAKNSHQR